MAFFFVLSGFVLSYGYGPRVSRGEFKGKRFFWKHFWHLYLLLRSIDFSLGIIAYRFYKTCPNVRKLPRLFPYVDVALLLAVYALYQITCPQIRCSMLFWPVMPLIVVRLTTADASQGWATRLLQSKPMSWLGSVSFEIFIAHLLVIRIVQHVVGYDGSEKLAAINLAVSIVSTILVAEALRRWFVKPLTDVINSRLLR